MNTLVGIYWLADVTTIGKAPDQRRLSVFCQHVNQLRAARADCGAVARGIDPSSKLSMGPFYVTQSNPAHRLSEPTQPTQWNDGVNWRGQRSKTRFILTACNLLGSVNAIFKLMTFNLGTDGYTLYDICRQYYELVKCLH